MSARKTPPTVKYDREKLKTILTREGVTKSSLCRELGYGETYLAHKETREDSHIPFSEFKLICRILNCKEEELKWQEPSLTNTQSVATTGKAETDIMVSFRNLSSLIQQEMAELKELCTEAAKMCESNHRDLMFVQKSLEKMGENDEAVWNKLNSITLSTAKLKSQVDDLKLDINDSLASLSDKLDASED